MAAPPFGAAQPHQPLQLPFPGTANDGGSQQLSLAANFGVSCPSASSASSCLLETSPHFLGQFGGAGPAAGSAFFHHLQSEAANLCAEVGGSALLGCHFPVTNFGGSPGLGCLEGQQLQQHQQQQFGHSQLFFHHQNPADLLLLGPQSASANYLLSSGENHQLESAHQHFLLQQMPLLANGNGTNGMNNNNFSHFHPIQTTTISASSAADATGGTGTHLNGGSLPSNQVGAIKSNTGSAGRRQPRMRRKDRLNGTAAGRPKMTLKEAMSTTTTMVDAMEGIANVGAGDHGEEKQIGDACSTAFSDANSALALAVPVPLRLSDQPSPVLLAKSAGMPPAGAVPPCDISSVFPSPTPALGEPAFCANCGQQICDRLMLVVGRKESAAAPSSSSAIGNGNGSGDSTTAAAIIGEELSAEKGQTQQQQYFHCHCLKCSECEDPLELAPKCFVRGGLMLCQQCYTKRFFCVGCEKKLFDPSGSIWIRRARHWKYHLCCFKCEHCGRQMNTGEQFSLDDSTQRHSQVFDANIPRLLCKQHYMELVRGEQCSPKPKAKRVRTTFGEEQLAILQEHFKVDSNPDGADLERIAQLTGLTKRVTQVWFQNSRARQKKYSGGGLSGSGRKLLGLTGDLCSSSNSNSSIGGNGMAGGGCRSSTVTPASSSSVGAQSPFEFGGNDSDNPNSGQQSSRKVFIGDSAPPSPASSQAGTMANGVALQSADLECQNTVLQPLDDNC